MELDELSECKLQFEFIENDFGFSVLFALLEIGLLWMSSSSGTESCGWFSGHKPKFAHNSCLWHGSSHILWPHTETGYIKWSLAIWKHTLTHSHIRTHTETHINTDNTHNRTEGTAGTQRTIRWLDTCRQWQRHSSGSWGLVKSSAAFCDLVVGWMVYVALGIGLGARGMGAT